MSGVCFRFKVVNFSRSRRIGVGMLDIKSFLVVFFVGSGMKFCTFFVLFFACYWVVFFDSGISVFGLWGLCMCNFIVVV